MSKKSCAKWTERVPSVDSGKQNDFGEPEYTCYRSRMFAANPTKIKSVQPTFNYSTTRTLNKPPFLSMQNETGMKIQIHNINKRINKFAANPTKIKSVQPKFNYSTTRTLNKPSFLSLKNETAMEIQIRNINMLTSNGLLRQYAQNEKRSEGGKIKQLVMENKYDRAVVIFEENSVAENFLYKDFHSLENITLYVSILPPFCKKRFYLENIPLWITHDCLKDYLETIAQCKVNGIIFHENNNGAVIIFNEPKWYSVLENKMKEKPLKDVDKEMNEFKICPVPYPNAVIVYGKIPSEDSLTLAFEDFLMENAPKHIPCDVWNVFAKEEKMTLVIFEDHRTILHLNDSITIAGETFTIAPFYDCLGWIPENNVANFIREHSSTLVKTKLSPLQIEFLSKDTCNQFVKGEIENLNFQCHFEIDEDEKAMTVTAVTKEMSSICSSFILTLMKSFDIILDDPMLRLWKENGSDLYAIISDKDKNLQSYFCFSHNQSKLCILVASCKFEIMKQIIYNFFADNSQYGECIVDSQIYGKYLKIYHESDLIKKYPRIAITFTHNGAVMVSGTKLRIEELKLTINDILSNCEIEKYIVLKPDMSDCFRSQIGWNKISVIAEKTQTVIYSENEFDEKVGKNSLSEVVLEGLLNPNLKISVVCGDITHQNVDAIVNAANERLEHNGGLAFTIVDAGGQQIQTECRNFIKRNGLLNVGMVYVSESGNLPCKEIIHAIGPRWKGGKSGEEGKLRKSIMNCVLVANDANRASIAIPAVSTKIFGYPVQLAIPAIVDSVADACKTAKNIQDVRFVDNDPNTAKLFAQYVKKLSGFQENVLSKPQKSVLPALNTPKLAPMFPINIPSSYSSQTNQQPASLCFNGCTIKLVKDDIVNVAKYSDVVVNTTSASNLLGGSASCNAIMNAAGPAYIQEIQRDYPNGLQGSSLARTTAGQLGCLFVYHIACPAWDPVTGPATVNSKINACFAQALMEGCTSIAFPAIGTGGLHYPADIIAKTMFDAAINWLNSEPNSTLINVFFVVFSSDIETAFENEYNLRLGTLALSTPIPPPTNSFSVKVGSIIVEVINGDIINEKTDSIICPCNGKVDLGKGQIANALKLLGGEELEKIIHKLKFKNHVLSVFTVKVLPYKCVLFINTSVADQSKLTDIFMQSLKQAKKHNLVSISVPALGIDQLDFINSEAADMMFHTIQSFATTDRYSKLKLIRIVIKEGLIYNHFCQHISTYFAPGKTMPSTTPMSRTLDWVIRKYDTIIPEEIDKVEQNLLLFICGPKHAVQRAQSMLDEICDSSNCLEKTIVKNIIGHLDKETIVILTDLAQEYNVKIFISEEHKKIKIKGYHAVQFQSHLNDILDKFNEEISESAVKWYKRQNALSLWDLMGLGVVRLEKAYQTAMKKGLVPFEFIDEEVLVDFDKMNILSKEENDILYQIKRIDSEHIPLEWEWNGKNKDEYNLVLLDKQCIEYIAVQNAVLLTSTANIQKIERLENPVKFQQYMVLKRKMELTMPNVNVEKNLFHGTKTGNVKGICTYGFNRSFCGQNGTNFGKGAYFAQDFSYSSNYGQETVFYANVLTGNFKQGDASMDVAPDLDTTKGIKYDSVVDNITNPKIYVVFLDDHAYPAYLITYV